QPGGRGRASGGLEAAIAAMERCGAARPRLSVALGPTIRQPNYEVGPEFVSRFLVANATNERFFRPSATPEHALFDLPGYIAARLAAAGMRRIEDLGPCTYADAAPFFSYRRSTHRDERDYGRHIKAIALVGYLRFGGKWRESAGTKPAPGGPSYCQPCRLLVIRARGRGASRQETGCGPITERSRLSPATPIL